MYVVMLAGHKFMILQISCPSNAVQISLKVFFFQFCHCTSELIIVPQRRNVIIVIEKNFVLQFEKEKKINNPVGCPLFFIVGDKCNSEYLLSLKTFKDFIYLSLFFGYLISYHFDILFPRLNEILLNELHYTYSISDLVAFQESGCHDLIYCSLSTLKITIWKPLVMFGQVLPYISYLI